jgi:serine/threonine protein kinase
MEIEMGATASTPVQLANNHLSRPLISQTSSENSPPPAVETPSTLKNNYPLNRNWRSNNHIIPTLKNNRRTKLHEIGSGAFGTTIKEQKGPNQVVTKYFIRPDDVIAENTAEIATLRYLKGLRYVAQIINTSNKNSRARCTSLSYPCVVMKAEQSSLHSWIKSYERKPFPLETAFTLCIDILQGYNVLHSAGIVHRDTKPENILITRSTNAIITDFGASVFTLPTIPYIQDEYTGTIWYTSPEVILHHILKYDYKRSRTDYSYIDGFAQDAWGVGIVLFNLLTGSDIFFSRTGSNNNQLYTILCAKGPITPDNGDIFVLYTDYLKYINYTNRTTFNTIRVPTQSIEQILEAAVPVDSSCRRLIPIITGLLDYNPTRRFTIQQALTSVVTSPPISIYTLPPMFEDLMILILQEPQNLATSYLAIDTCMSTIRTIINIDDTYHILFDRACLFFLQLVQIKKLDPTKLEIYYYVMILLAYALFDNKRHEVNNKSKITNFNFLISKLSVTGSTKSLMDLIKNILLVDIQFLGKMILDKMLASMVPLTPEKIKRAHEINKHCFVTNMYTTLLQSMKPDELVAALSEFANSNEPISSLNSTLHHPATSAGGSRPRLKRRTPKKPRKSVTRRKRAGV